MNKPVIRIALGLFLFLVLEAKGQHFQYVGSTLWGGARELEVVGHYAYCPFQNGFVILNVSRPDSMVSMSQLYIPLEIADSKGEFVRVQGSYAYMCYGQGGVKIICISDPSNPTLAASCPTPGYAYALSISGHYLYVADGAAGMQVIDIINPSVPIIVGNCTAAGAAEDIAVSGNYAYIANGIQGFMVIDISDPGNPVAIASREGIGSVSGIALQGSYAYLSTVFNSSLLIYDISYPPNPVLVGSYGPGLNAADVIVRGSYAFEANGTGLVIINISNPEAPMLASAMDPVGQWVDDIFITDSLVYISDYQTSIMVANIQNPLQPNIIGEYEAPGTTYSICVQENYAFTASSMNVRTDVKITDISNPLAPRVISGFNTPGECTGVSIAGNYLYCADYNPTSLLILDISDKDNPHIAGAFAPIDGIWDIFLAENRAYLATSGGLRIIDVTDPTNPVLLGAFDTPSPATALQVIGDTAFMTSFWDGLWVIDIADVAYPELLGYIDLYNPPTDIVVLGDYAYVAGNYYHSAGNTRLYIINISNPAHLEITGSSIFGNWESAWSVAVYHDYAFVSCEGDGLKLVDVTDRANPVLLDTYRTTGWALDAAVVGDFVYLAHEASLIILRYDSNGPSVPCSSYVTGDINGSGRFDGLDVVFSVNFLKGGLAPLYRCECTPGNSWFVAGDLNASCSFNGLDVTFGVSYLKGGPSPSPCPDCPPQ